MQCFKQLALKTCLGHGCADFDTKCVEKKHKVKLTVLNHIFTFRIAI